MADNTKIEWADATVNYINGCSVHSPGCTNCYAMKLAGTRLRNHPTREGLTTDSKAGPVWNGTVRNHEPALMQVLGWERPRRIFWNAHGDTFHEAVPDEWIDRMFAVCALTPQHTHMILTKRSARARQYLSNDLLPILIAMNVEALTDKECSSQSIEDRLPLSNVWLGVSVEDQTRADERREDFRNTPAAVKFVSYEPALGPVDWSGWEFVDQIIAGGEGGPKARPPHPDWFRDTRDWCAPNDVAFFFKQWGEWEVALDRERDDPDWRADYSNNYVDRGKSKWLNLAGGSGFHGERFHVMRRVGKKAAGRLLDGVEHSAFPRGAV